MNTTVISYKIKKLCQSFFLLGIVLIVVSGITVVFTSSFFNVKAKAPIDIKDVKSLTNSDIDDSCAKMAQQIKETINSEESLTYYNSLVSQRAQDTDFLDVYRLVCVDKDNTATVYEFYVKYFGQPHHGIFRYIYLARRNLYGQAILQPVDDVDVSYWYVKTPGNIYHTYDKSYIEQDVPAFVGNYEGYPKTVFLKIGDEDETITGIWAYEISYKQSNIVYTASSEFLSTKVDDIEVDNSLVFSDIVLPDFLDKNAMYYRVNAIYLLPKDSIDFYAELKEGSNYKDMNVQKEKGANFDIYFVYLDKPINVVDPATLQTNTIRFTSFYKNGTFKDKSSEYQSLINDAVNFINEKSNTARALGFLATIIGLVLVYYIWNIYGKDRKPPAIAPEYVVDDELKNFGFMEMELLMSLLTSSKKGLSKSVTADVISLARKGYIKIDHQNRSKTYIKLITKDLKPDEIWYYKDLLYYVTNRYSTLTSVSNLDISYKLKSLRRKIWKRLKQLGLVQSASGKALLMLWGIVIGTIFAILFCFSIVYDKAEVIGNLGITIEAIEEKVNVITGLSLMEMIAVIIAGVIASIYMPRRTDKGYDLYIKLLGLKRYISKAEIKEIKFFNDPDKIIEHFEELLPFAVMFGLEKKWIKRFKDLLAELNYNPSWYNSYYGWSSVSGITRSISSLSSVTSAIASSSIPSSYSSSGGFSAGGGGGTSGGGGGGTW